MHVAVDEPWNDREAAAIDAGGTFGYREGPTWTNSCDQRPAHEHCGLIEQGSCPIDEERVMDCDGHELPFYKFTSQRLTSWKWLSAKVGRLFEDGPLNISTF